MRTMIFQQKSKSKSKQNIMKCLESYFVYRNYIYEFLALGLRILNWLPKHHCHKNLKQITTKAFSHCSFKSAMQMRKMFKFKYIIE